MKRRNILTVGFILVLIMVPLAVADNPFDETQSLLQIMIAKLSAILEKLVIIAEKNSTVIVEPPEVNVEVNPNITLPEKECGWESYSQTNRLDIKADVTYISVPQNKLFEDVNVTKSIVKARNCGPIIIKVNGVECLHTGGGTAITFSNLCPEIFKEGLNKIEFIGGSIPSLGCSAELHDIYLEMDILPTNC